MKNLPFTGKLRRGTGLLSLGLFLLLPVLFAQTGPLAKVATVQEIEGHLRIARTGKFLAAQTKKPIFPGDVLETGQRDRALIQFEADGTLVKLANGTKLQILPEGKAQVYLSEGLVWGKRTSGGTPFAIETPVMVTAVRGTEFFVKSIGSDQSVVLVKEGVVEVNFGGEVSAVGPMKIGFFQKGIGLRVSPIDENILKDWAAQFGEE